MIPTLPPRTYCSPRLGNLVLGATSAPILNNATYDAWPAVATLADGRLIMVIRRGTSHSSNDGEIFYALSCTQGKTWSALTQITRPEGNRGHRDPGVAVLSDGRVAVNYLTDDTPVGRLRAVFARVAWNGVLSFGDPVTIPDGFATYSGAATNLVETPDGRLILAYYGKDANDGGTSYYSPPLSSALIDSRDGGQTWGNRRVIARGYAGRSWDEWGFVVMPSGRWVGIIRTQNNGWPEEGYFRTYSDDNGATWSTPVNVLPSVNCGKPNPILLSSGALFMVIRYGMNGFTHYTTSWDEGVTWATPTQLGPNNTAEYAGLTRLSGGNVACVYAYDVGTGLVATEVNYQEFQDGFGVMSQGSVVAKCLSVGGGGSRLTWLKREAYSYASTGLAVGASVDVPVTVASSILSDDVTVTQASPNAFVMASGFISTPGTATVRLTNVGAAAVPATTFSGSVKVEHYE